MKKILFIGLGAIGQRHIKNLARLLKNEDCYKIDALRSTKKKIPPNIQKLISKEYCSFKELPDDYDVAFITNPTYLHYMTLQRLGCKAKHFFIEKPIFDKINYDILSLNLNKTSIYYIACPLRYTSVIKYLKQYLQGKNVFAARVICSTYLPEWHPESDYRKSYSAKYEEGGGVSLDLIHEWDYLYYLFGFPEDVYYASGKYSDLDISSDDLALYIGKYKNKLISLHLDYFGREMRREIELYLRDGTVIGDIINNQIRFSESGEVIQFDETRDDFQYKELQYFFDLINGKQENYNDITIAMRILKIARGEG